MPELIESEWIMLNNAYPCEYQDWQWEYKFCELLPKSVIYSISHPNLAYMKRHKLYELLHKLVMGVPVL